MTIVAEVTRSGLVESRHHGSIVGLDIAGSTALAVGDIHGAVYGRSSNKPFQAVAMVRHGLALPPDLLALTTASHSGEARHLAGVRRILALAGLDESALQNTAMAPLDEGATEDMIRAGTAPSALTHNCSGKHASMLLTCAANDWPLDDYLRETHPLQQAIAATIEELAGEPVAHVGVDGCGAPAHAVSLVGLARAIRTVAMACGSAQAAVTAAMRANPFLVGGTGRDVTAIMSAIPGLVAKDGAEGVYVAAMPDGRAVAMKIDDGSSRARPIVLLAALRSLGVDTSGADSAVHVAVLGHGREVGTVRLTDWSMLESADPTADNGSCSS